MGEPLLQDWPEAKPAVAHNDGGLVTEIIVDTHYLSSVLLSYLSSDELVFRNLRKFLNLNDKNLIVHTKIKGFVIYSFQTFKTFSRA